MTAVLHAVRTCDLNLQGIETVDPCKTCTGFPGLSSIVTRVVVPRNEIGTGVNGRPRHTVVPESYHAFHGAVLEIGSWVQHEGMPDHEDI